MTSVLYAVGSGSAAATGGAWLLVDAPPTAAVVGHIWTRLTAGLGREALLDALRDLPDLPSFALVLATPPGAVVVSGGARVVLEGDEQHPIDAGADSGGWTEVPLPAGTTAATLTTGRDVSVEDARIPALAGVFPASTLTVRWLPPPVPAVPPRPRSAPPVIPPAPSVPPPTSEAAEEPTEVLPSSVPSAVSSTDSFFDQDALPSVPARPSAPPRPVGPPPSAPVAADHGVLRISTGEAIVLDRGAVLGRSPEWHGPDQRHLVTVVGSFGDVSRSHVGVSLDGEGVRVEDLGSTNGTLVSQPGAGQHLLQVGVAERLEPGAVVTLSRDVSFTYEIDLR